MAETRVWKWALTRHITIAAGGKQKIIELASTQLFTTKKMAQINQTTEQNRVAAAMKAAYNNAPSGDDILCIGSITVDARTIVAAEFLIHRMSVIDDADAEDTSEISGEAINSTDGISIPGALCVPDGEDDEAQET